MSYELKVIFITIIIAIIVSRLENMYEKYRYESIIPGNPPLKATITQTSHRGYKWVVNHRHGFAGSYRQAVLQAKKQADKDRLDYKYKEDTRSIEV